MKVTQQAGKTSYFNGMPVSAPNEVRQNCDKFYISYNNRDTRIYGSDTTALVIGNCDKFYILNGDHRKQYEEAQTLEACMAYYKANPELQSTFSDKLVESTSE